MSDFGKKLVSGLGEGLGSGIAGMGLSMIGGLFGGIKAKKAHKRQKELMQLQNQLEIERMGLQADLNKEQANYSQDLAKEMFNYTFNKEAEYNNPTEQIKRMKAAGLNPALMYAGSSAGASGTASGSTEGAGIAAGTTGIQPMGLQVALQAESQRAQIELAQSQAAKNWADAGKTIGIDTLQGKQNLRESESKVLKNLAEEAKSREEINEIRERIKGIKIDNDINEETKKYQIDEKIETLNILKQTAALNVIKAVKDENEAKLVKKELDNFDTKLQALLDDVQSRKISADAAWATYEAQAAWLKKQYGNKDAEELATYMGIFKDILETLIDLIPGSKAVKVAKKLSK